ncbi:MAG: FprA family A-type flavoprotein [Methylocystaceae bacterium]|nr:FprA family A-type flavoprotein [Methylocystaceae bacterium]
MDGMPITGTQAVAIGSDVYWIGAFDPSLRSFDLILKTANGTSYNSYLVRGADGVCIVDTVKKEFQDIFFKRLESICAYDEIKYIVLNHMEPDHTGALPELLKRAPNAKVYLSFQAQGMLKGLLKEGAENLDVTAVTTGDSIDLGNRKVSFINTPFLHWPDTQCTWLEDCGMLLSGDLFGCHFCDERLFNDLVGDFRFSFEYYYAHIMRPFKHHVLQALDLIEPLDIKLIAPAHGPILREHPREYVRHYHSMSVPHLRREGEITEKTLLIFYMSAYGSTGDMAKEVLKGAEQVSGVRISLYDLEGGEMPPFVDLIEEADGLVFGSPTINGDAVKPVWDLLSSLCSIHTQGKLGAAFGSYGWTGEAVAMIEDRLRGLKFKVPVPGVKVKLIPTNEELEECRAFGRLIAENLTGTNAPRVIDFSDLL